MNESINITKLCSILKDNIPNRKFTVSAEVSQPKISHGHLYLTLKDESSTIKAIIWKSKLEKIKINDGDKIIVDGRLDYYSFSGTISFIIDNILENDGIGNLQQTYDLIKKDFESKGYFNKDLKLKLPKVIKNILILTSKTGAAIHDFLFTLENNKSKIEYTILDVPVQGIDSPSLIAAELDNLEELNYDIIIITRGGGSFQDLFGFSDPILIEAVNNFKKIPILSAIGHQVDNPLLDLVADHSCPTPSLAAQCLVDINKNYINNIISLKNRYRDFIIQNLNNNQKRLFVISNQLNETYTSLNKIANKMRNQLENELQNKKRKLEYLLLSLDSSNIEIFNTDMIKILDPDNIVKGDKLFLRWNDKQFKIKIII